MKAVFQDGEEQSLYCPISLEKKTIESLGCQVRLRLNRDPEGEHRTRSILLNSAEENSWNMVDRHLDPDRNVAIGLYTVNGDWTFIRGFRLEYETPSSYYLRETYRQLRRMVRVILYREKRDAFLKRFREYSEYFLSPRLPLIVALILFLLSPNFLNAFLLAYVVLFEYTHKILPDFSPLVVRIFEFLSLQPEDQVDKTPSDS